MLSLLAHTSLSISNQVNDRVSSGRKHTEYIMQLGFLVPIAVNFAIRQLEKFGQGLDMAILRKDFETRVRDLVPGTVWDEASVALSDKIFNIFAELFTSEVIGSTVQDLLDKKYAEAFAHVQEYVVKQLAK